MKIEQMVASQLDYFSEQISKSILLLPFYSTHTLARQVFNKKTRENSGIAYVIYRGKTPYMFLTVEEGVVTNVLIRESLKISWTAIFLMIEKLFKQSFQPTITFDFSQSLTLHLQEVFLKQGYMVHEGRISTKDLSYNTALVLGGGGARGAYQIGVWQALEELGISLKIITGTSVGALNGALILQDDFEAAKNMWEKIDTQKILSFPVTAASADTLSGMVSQIGSFTVNAIQSNGVSTLPLRKLINDTFSQEKMRQVTSDFYLVTTELPNLQEKDIHFNTCKSDRWQSWLLASASFFPAMAATQIDGKYYVDGGYRNNIPVDIALKNGATECIVVDVKGPGITKPIKISATATMLNLQTSWSMGAVLLFDGARSTQNIKLGYLETMKVIGRKYLGHWYTFDETLKNVEKFQQDFFVYIKNAYQINLCDSTEQQNKICKKLRKVYKDRVYTENIGLVLVELLAKSQEISASKLYKIEELVEILQKSGQMKVDLVETIGMISIQEWLKKYYEDYFLLSDKQQLSLMNNLLDADEKEKPQRLAFLLDKLPTQTLQILMKEFILQGVDE
ncbi:patatin-like phospholipase family protein [Enterococcus ureasiticus]|uniref:PNPLA domain-containing protein n=1 Tax=Enterococcus ureasiticus TaxID=903984 RepID=A0A1E5GC49_9ENTE|nr:patatin-like phospholipase family protein [Enterococcus ureasiticus]OEG10237.1 hypothetical protein BCR21_12865 [Enterococcus ureasiticus]